MRQRTSTQCTPFKWPAATTYHLDTGDSVRVVVFEQESLSGTYIVDATGRIMMPLIGQVSARGRSTSGLASTIRTRLASGYLREPDVSVELAQTRPFYIHGVVSRPGAYRFAPGMTVERAVALAGGFTSRADARIVSVDRRSGTATLEAIVYQLSLLDAVLPGDTIYVKERLF
ncbi:MAG: polysaccharide export protein [Rhizobiales bacterium]|nr:polysaccharide export protein [Hyphomicrobiales bacterium]